MNYYIGVDGGGTKSVLTAVDESGQEIVTLKGGPTNMHAYGIERVEENISQLVNELTTQEGLKIQNCIGFCIGSAGIDKACDIPKMHKAIKNIGFTCRVQVVNDSEIILEAEKECEAGVAIISGTGSIGFGSDSNGNQLKSGGWGHLLGDEGSGYWIANEAIVSAVRSADGRSEKTLLLDSIMTDLQITDPYQIIDFVYKECAADKGKLARLSSVVAQTALMGDKEAQRILNEAANELTLLGTTILNKLDYQGQAIVVCSGGILQNNDFIFNTVKESLEGLYKQVHVVRLSKNPVWGAVKMAMQTPEV